MGQYYAPVVIGGDGVSGPMVRWWFFAHMYGNGLKLMEHSYVGNDFVRAVETFLRLDGGVRLVWAGDYADAEPDGKNLWQRTLDATGEDHDYSRCVAITSALEPLYPGHEPVLKRMTAASHQVEMKLAADADCRYVINLDTEQYVDTDLAPQAEPGWDARIHPLPLLTCEGNGRGGGDYHGSSAVIGSWARARITVSGRVPQGFSELDFASALTGVGVGVAM